MGDIARGSHRFVAGCTRCLRTALARIPIREDEDGFAETGRTREGLWRRDPAGASPTLARALLAGSAVVAGSSQRLRTALAGIPIADDEDGRPERAHRRRVAMASPTLAGALLAGTVAASPVQAQTPPTQAEAAPALAGAARAPAEAEAAPAQPPPPPPPPPEQPMVLELSAGGGVPVGVIPLGGEVGILVHPDGSFQLTFMGGLYAGVKGGAEIRQARASGLVGEAKLQGSLGPALSGDVVLQTDGSRLGGSWKAQGGPTVVGQSYEVTPNPSVEGRGGGQARFPGPQPVGIVGGLGPRYTTPVIPVDIIQVVEDWQNAAAGPIDPGRFDPAFDPTPAEVSAGVADPEPEPVDPWVSIIEWAEENISVGGPPEDLPWIEGSEIDQPPPVDWGRVGEAVTPVLEPWADAFEVHAEGLGLSPGTGPDEPESAPAVPPETPPGEPVVSSDVGEPVETAESGMDWDQVMQDMTSPVLVDPEQFQDDPAEAEPEPEAVDPGLEVAVEAVEAVAAPGDPVQAGEAAVDAAEAVEGAEPEPEVAEPEAEVAESEPEVVDPGLEVAVEAVEAVAAPGDPVEAAEAAVDAAEAVEAAEPAPEAAVAEPDAEPPAAEPASTPGLPPIQGPF